jgi:protein arginine kinase
VRTPADDDLAGLGEWLRGTGPDADIAICTRVRFARNVDGYHFSTSMTELESRELTTFLGKQLTRADFVEPLRLLTLPGLDDIERKVLMERHLISREHAESQKPRDVAVNADESISIMINEEDHLRVQVFHSGRAIEATYRRAESLDDGILQRISVAFSEEFGFLTACPTNAGTGLRVSVMLHLPALVWTDEIEKATHAAQKAFMAVRGMYGEGSRALGDLYQVSNQVTLGRSESTIAADVATAVERLLAWERGVREALLSGEGRAKTLDRVFRSLGTLERARILTSEEALTCLSAVRFGVQQGLIDDLEMTQLNRALLLSQPAHLQRMEGRLLGPSERDSERANLIRKLLGKA